MSLRVSSILDHLLQTVQIRSSKLPITQLHSFQNWFSQNHSSHPTYLRNELIVLVELVGRNTLQIRWGGDAKYSNGLFHHDVGAVVDINLDEVHVVVRSTEQGELGSDHLARTAPGGREVHNTRLVSLGNERISM